MLTGKRATSFQRRCRGLARMLGNASPRKRPPSPWAVTILLAGAVTLLPRRPLHDGRAPPPPRTTLRGKSIYFLFVLEVPCCGTLFCRDCLARWADNAVGDSRCGGWRRFRPAGGRSSRRPRRDAPVQ